MGALRRRAQTWTIPAMLAVPCCLLACSLQNFSYLSRDRGADDSGSPESGGAGPDDASVDGDGGSDGSPDGGDATSTRDAPAREAATAQDGGDGAASEGGEAGDAGDGGTGNLLVNPGFEQGYIGWNFGPTTAMGKYAYTQFPPTGATNIEGQYELATWSGTDAFSVRVYQVLSAVPPGLYAFRGWFNRGVNKAAYIYANCGGTNLQVDIPLTAPTSWIQVSITGIVATGGSCEVGCFVDANPTDWMNADAFTFELMPPGPADGGDAGAGDGAGE